jgi:hypothetical protein
VLGIIIFGTKGVERTAGNGFFHCPHCRTDAPYTKKKLTRFFTLYFIPLIPLGTISEFVRCDQCGSDFSTEALSLTRQDVQRISAPWECPQCTNVNPPEYSSCLSCGANRPGGR